MAIYLCHERPDLYEHDATIVDARPGAALLSRSAFHPGGGGQACGRTHLTNTAQSRAFKIGKIENKGKRNRRVRFTLG